MTKNNAARLDEINAATREVTAFDCFSDLLAQIQTRGYVPSLRPAASPAERLLAEALVQEGGRYFDGERTHGRGGQPR